MILIATLIGWNILLDWLAFRFKKFRRFVEPGLLQRARDSKLIRRNMQRQFITDEEPWSTLREHDIESLDLVKAAHL